MIVRCDNCGSEFRFDDKQVGEGITVRCSVCKHVFKLESPGAAPAGWIIRTTEDTHFNAPDVSTLREWIGEGRLHPDDEVSRTGRKWVRLGDMPEFADAFAGFAGVSPVVQASAEPPPPSGPHPQAPRQNHPPIRPPVGPSGRPPAGSVREPPPSPVRPHTREGVISTMPPIPPAQPSARPSNAPQSSRPTVSPPRSSPPQAAAPVAVADEDLLESDDGGDDEPTAARSWGGLLAENSDEFEQVETQVRARQRDPSAPRPRSRRESGSGPRARQAPRPPAGEGLAVEAFDELEPAGGGGISPAWILVALLVVGVVVVLAVPQLREPILALVAGDTAETPAAAVDGPELRAAASARRTLGVAETAKAEADLQRAIDAGEVDPATLTEMKVARADLLLSRALIYEMAAAIDDEQRADLEHRAHEDQEDGERIVDSLEGGTDVDRLAEVRALARLAAGRAETEVLPLVPDDAVETRLVVDASVLWRDLDAPVPEGVVSGLVELESRTALGESTLALAMVRAGDEAGARAAAERLLAGAPDQSVGLALRTKLGASEDLGTGETGDAGETGGTGETGDTGEIAKAPPPPGEEPSTTGGGGGDGGGGGGGGGNFDTLVNKGCGQVNKGDYHLGLDTLLRAANKRPDNFQVLMCLGRGYLGYGSAAKARDYYEKALDQAPNNRGALLGAAKACDRSGAKQKAKSYYERVLTVDPDNSTAKAYLEKDAKPPPDPAPAGEGGG